MIASIDYEENDCPLCLVPLESHDHSHPLQCRSRHCRFNCCVDCLERLVESAKDDRVEASDGNTFRVCLHCPNCRSDLSATIRDTLLLRKVDKYSHRVFPDGTDVIADERLSASELEFKYALEDDDGGVASAIEKAQIREDDFFGRSLRLCVTSFETNVSRTSFVQDLEDAADETKLFENVQADTTLLCGLDAFMTVQEQKFMTAQFVSGDTMKLAAAAQMMHYVSALSREGIKPNSLRQTSCMLEGIKEIIREGNEARRREEERPIVAPSQQIKWQQTDATKAAKIYAKNQEKQDRKTKLQKMEYLRTKKQMEYLKLHPLPLRMPKYAEVTVAESGSAGLTFLDDVWDGNMQDAYCKINVKASLLGNITVTKQCADNSGMRFVIDAGSPESDRNGQFNDEQPRVIVASISRDLGRQGVVKGDVVSHFNGERFAGTASELEKLIGEGYRGEVLTFAFNADSAVAEALKRRSIVTRTERKKTRNQRSRRGPWARLLKLKAKSKPPANSSRTLFEA